MRGGPEPVGAFAEPVPLFAGGAVAATPCPARVCGRRGPRRPAWGGLQPAGRKAPSYGGARPAARPANTGPPGHAAGGRAAPGLQAEWARGRPGPGFSALRPFPGRRLEPGWLEAVAHGSSAGLVGAGVLVELGRVEGRRSEQVALVLGVLDLVAAAELGRRVGELRPRVSRRGRLRFLDELGDGLAGE